MNASELKYHVENIGSSFFTRESMRFSGDTMCNYGVCSTVIVTNYNESGNWVENGGASVEVWELYRRQAVKYGLRTSAYFDKRTFLRIHPKL